MLNQETIDTLNRLIENPLINSVDFTLRSYAGPQISIQSKQDASEEEVLALVKKELSEVELRNYHMDFEHVNAWGNSYEGELNGVEVSLITSTTKEAPQQEGADKENTQTDYTKETWTVEEILRREA